MAFDPKQLRAFALLGLVMLFWAGNAIVGRAVSGDVPPFTLSLIRWVGALTFLAPFAIAPVRRDVAEIRKSWAIILVLGLLGVGLFNAMLYTGLHYTTATNALLILAAIPPLVVLIDRLVFGVRSEWLQIIGTVLSIIGVAIIVFRGDLAAALALQLGGGDVILLGAALVWALYTSLLRLRPAIAPTSLIATTFVVGALATVPLALWEWHQGLRVAWSWPVGAALLYVALLPSLLSFFIYNHAAQVVGPARAGQAITMMPVFGAFLSALLLGEALHSYHALGIGIICIGIAIGAWALRQAAKRHAANAGG